MCGFTNFVTFSNPHNDICFVNQTKTDFWWEKSLFNKTAIVSSIAKSDKISKKHISFDLRKSHETYETSLTRFFARFQLKQTFGGKSLFNKTAIILSVAKSDKIGKITHLVCTRLHVRMRTP